MSECTETYKECMEAHDARYRAIIASREPWETAKDLAKRAGCHRATIHRLLQSDAAATLCNNDDCSVPFAIGSKSFEVIKNHLPKITDPIEREIIRNIIKEFWQ